MAEHYLEYENKKEQKATSRITEQLVEQELLETIERIRVDGIAYIETTKDDANAYITNKKENDTDGVIKRGKDINGDIHFEDEDDVDNVISNTVNKGILGENYIGTKQIYQDTLEIVPNTENEIETNIRQYIADKGYSIGVVSDDGDGNVVFGVVKEGE